MSGNEYINLYAPFYPLFNKNEMDSYLLEFQLNPKASLNKLSFGQKENSYFPLHLQVIHR